MKKNKSYLCILIDFLYKNRFTISLFVFLFCLFFKISGSSIGCWNNFIDLGKSDLSFGINRFVRSDEWGTLTPLFFSQVENGFHYFNNSLRAAPTDVFIVYALPVIFIFQIFRPFLIGFILLGAERGLSFFWCGRLITLFLVSLDFFMIITKKNKPLSYIGALMITLSPIIQWWFAVNGIAELFIFGETIIIVLYKYLNNNSYKKRIIYLLLFYISAGGYALIMYPSWQIPMAYVFLALSIWVIADNYKNSNIKKRDLLSILITILILFVSLFFIFYKSIDTIKIIANTDYPGKRFELGGGQLKYLLTYLTNVFLPFRNSGLIINASEDALMFSLFPIGLLLSLRNIIKMEKKDLLTICMLIVYVFIGIWCIFGFPSFLSKITLMSNSQAHRSLLALGFIDIMLLIRAFSIEKESMRIKSSIVLTLILSVLLVLNNMKYLNLIKLVCIVIIALYLFYTAFRYNTKYGKYLFALGIIFVMFISGGLVNPIRFGSSSLLKNDIIKNVKDIDKKNKGIWITEGEGYPINNFIAIAGVKTINVTNTYPDLNKWYKIDKEKKYKEIYNRYAHITINITDDVKEKFVLTNPDLFVVNLKVSDLDSLNINYIFTRNDLKKFDSDIYTFNPIYNYKDFTIYEILKK